MINLIFLFIGFMLIFSALRNRDNLLLFFQFSFAVITLVFSLTGILNFLLNPVSRSYAILGDRVFDSEFLSAILVFPFFLSVFYKTRKPILVYFLLVVNIVSSVYLITLRTRTGWVAASIVIVTMVLFICKHQRISLVFNKIILKIGVVVALSLIFAYVIPFKKENDRSDLIKTTESIFNANYYSNQSRLSFWNASLKMFLQNPVSGVGAGKWPGLYPVYAGESYNDENVDMNFAVNPHNDYLEVLSEYGIFGFLLFTGFAFTGLYFLFRTAKNDVQHLPFFLSAMCICITMFFSFPKDNLWVMLIFSLCMGAGYSSNYKLSIINYKFSNKNKIILKSLMLIVGFTLLSTIIWFKLMSHLNERTYLEAMDLKAQGKYSEMLQKLDKVSDFYYPVDMNKMPVDYYRGAAFFELKQYDKALEKFVSSGKRMEYYPTVINNEASALYMTGNYNEAEKRYLEVKRLFPNYIEPQINLLSLYANQKRYSETKTLIAELDNISINIKYVKNYSVFLVIKNYFKETIH
jgi:O-antigen ligase